MPNASRFFFIVIIVLFIIGFISYVSYFKVGTDALVCPTQEYELTE
ncbi:hypothetical protein HMPREF0973_01027 [Prevotella veroralis F0319]|uniref:Uncharacterized protein n=1 Tax=Prevotella veroralis F0319 TaxID=649761 RepID=C9MN41_9BACT|nr:hypothetical protein HMPREF0973_01027 [Prevotella veroralis F0319]